MKGLIFVYLLTYGGAVLSLVRPFYGLLVYMCFAVLRPDHLWAWSLADDGGFSKVVGIALLIGWAFHGFGDWRFGAAKPLPTLLVGYWLCIVASAILASNQQVAWQYVSLHSKILIPVLVGMTIIRTAAEVRMVVWTLALSIGFLSFEAHSMYYKGMLVQFRENGMLGMDNNSICIAMAAGAGLSVFLGFSETKLRSKLLAFALAAMMVHVPMFGNSRGGMLGVLVVGVVAFVVLPKKPSVLLTFGIGVVVAVRLAGPQVVERFSTIFANNETRDTSSQSRVDLWADCWDVMVNHPLLGVGPDHWPLVASQYGWPPGKEAHSIWFNAGAELGFTGLILISSFYLLTVWVAWRCLCRNPNASEHDKWIGRMVIAALSGFMVSASFVSLDALEVPFYIVLISVGAIKASSRESVVLDLARNSRTSKTGTNRRNWKTNSKPALGPVRFKLRAK